MDAPVGPMQAPWKPASRSDSLGGEDSAVLGGDIIAALGGDVMAALGEDSCTRLVICTGCAVRTRTVVGVVVPVVQGDECDPHAGLEPAEQRATALWVMDIGPSALALSINSRAECVSRPTMPMGPERQRNTPLLRTPEDLLAVPDPPASPQSGELSGLELHAWPRCDVGDMCTAKACVPEHGRYDKLL